MDANEYMQLTWRSASSQPLGELSETDRLTLHTALQKAADSGEFADKVKKAYLQGHTNIDKNELAVHNSASSGSEVTQFNMEQTRLINAALGLSGEGGEFASLIDQALFQKQAISREKLVSELGDILWYVCQACAGLNLELAEVMEYNIAKLRKRYPTGFSQEASMARRDVAEAEKS
jgi:NTP pyrophosphatase (non-canonical NTP hydrolase)